MSPGPWWGFNGVHSLELHNGLFIDGFRTLLHGRIARVYAVGEIVVRSHGIYKRGGQARSRLEISARGRTMRFTGPVDDSEAFIEELIRTCDVSHLRERR